MSTWLKLKNTSDISVSYYTYNWTPEGWVETAIALTSGDLASDGGHGKALQPNNQWKRYYLFITKPSIPPNRIDEGYANTDFDDKGDSKVANAEYTGGDNINITYTDN